MYNQNNFKLSKIRSGLHVAMYVLALIMTGAFAMGVLSAIFEMIGY